MAEAKRRIAATRKVSLEDYADDWQDCFAIVTLATFEEYREITTKDFKAMQTMEIVEFELGIVKDHFVSGKIKVLGTDGSMTLEDMQIEDVTSLPGMVDRLYRVIMGLTMDPKASRTAAEASSTPSSSENTTKTT